MIYLYNSMSPKKLNSHGWFVQLDCSVQNKKKSFLEIVTETIRNVFGIFDSDVFDSDPQNQKGLTATHNGYMNHV